MPALAVGLLGVLPASAGSADEDAVAKSVEAFRKAQIAADAKAFDALCAAKLSYSQSDGRVEDKATFYQSPYPDELAKTGCGLEASVPRVNQALIG